MQIKKIYVRTKSINNMVLLHVPFYLGLFLWWYSITVLILLPYWSSNFFMDCILIFLSTEQCTFRFVYSYGSSLVNFVLLGNHICRPESTLYDTPRRPSSKCSFHLLKSLSATKAMKNDWIVPRKLHVALNMSFDGYWFKMGPCSNYIILESYYW